MPTDPTTARTGRAALAGEVARLLDAMTFDEKLGQLTAVPLPADDGDDAPLPGPAPGVVLVPRLPKAEALRRIAAFRRRTAAGRVRALPVAANGMLGDHMPAGQAGLACWDQQLTQQVAELEARRLRRSGILATVERIVPSTATDPMLAGALAVAFVHGAQGVPAGTSVRIGADRVAVGVAPFGPAANGDWHERTLRTGILAGVEAAVAAGAALVVPSTAANAGIPAHADRWLLQDLLREEWRFSGMVLAAPGGVDGLIEPHRVATGAGGALALAFESGVDVVAFGEEARSRLGRLVADGDLPAWLVDDAVAAVLQVKHRLGLLDEELADPPEPPDQDTNELWRLRSHALRQSLVLVSDPAEILPLDPARSVAVLSVDPNSGPDIDAMVAALAGVLPGTAVRAAVEPGTADVVVVLATDPDTAAPVAARAVAGGRRCVVLMCSHHTEGLAALATTMASVLVCWGPIAQRADVVAEVLAGRAEPGGRLPGAVPARQPGMRPAFPLGHGRGYTTFRFSALGIAPRDLRPTETLLVRCRVTNTGNRTGREVVQVYLRHGPRSVSAPAPALAGFATVTLAAGQTSTVTVRIPPSRLAVWDRSMRHVVEHGRIEVLVGASERDIRLSGTVSVSSTSALPARGSR